MEEEKKYTLEELREKLTEKERIFCHQWIIDWNGARAAREAGYSEKTCAETAYENLRKPHIKQYIEFIKNDFEKECGISKTMQINQLMKIAYADISDLHDTWISLEDFDLLKKEHPDTLSIIEVIDTKTETKTLRAGEDKDIDVEMKFVKIKLPSKLPALKEINEMLDYKSAQKIDHTTKGESLNDLALQSTEDLVKRAQAIKDIGDKS